MKLAIISLNNHGRKLAQQIFQRLEQDHTVLRVDLFHKNVKKTLEEIFPKYDCILGILASGIMVRSVAPLLKNKYEDPAILVMDEMGKHVISLLSGHLGGGNEYAIKIAELVGAVPVITTATDVMGKMGIDSLARKYYMTIDNPSRIRAINQALLVGNTVELALPPRFGYLYSDRQVENSYITVSSLSDNIEARLIGDVLDDPLNEITSNDSKIILSPLKLVVGLGARKGISKDMVLAAVKEALDDLKIPIKRIDSFATAEPKGKEIGILKAAEELDLPLEVHPLDDLKNFNDPQCSESPLVMRTFGIPGISEPSALLTAGLGARLIYRKKASYKVTVAVAVSNGP